MMPTRAVAEVPTPQISTIFGIETSDFDSDPARISIPIPAKFWLKTGILMYF